MKQTHSFGELQRVDVTLDGKDFEQQARNALPEGAKDFRLVMLEEGTDEYENPTIELRFERVEIKEPSP